MRIFTRETEGQFIRMGFADDVSACIEQALHGAGGASGRGMRRQPRWATEAGVKTGDVVNILDAAGKAGQRTSACATHFSMRVPAEGIERIAFEN